MLEYDKLSIIMKTGGSAMIEVYIDGASAGNPGPSGAGIFIKGNGTAENFHSRSE